MRINNERGVALAFSLLLVLVIIALSSIFIMRTVHESNMVKREIGMAKSFYIAEGGSHSALDGLDNLINNFLLNTISGMNPSVVINTAQTYIGTNDGIGFLVDTVEDGGAEVLTQNGEQAEYTVGATALGDGTYAYNIIFTEKTDPVTVTSDVWDFPYNYRVESTGAADNADREVLVTGDFTVRVQRDNFAKYALFTNEQQTPQGYNVWFTDNTNFSGPLHTNGRYNIYGNPSGTFEGLVEQQEQLARFYNSGWTVLLDDDHNGTTDVPTFNAGFNRGVDAITLGSPVQEQDLIDQATGGGSYAGNGIYVPHDGSGNLTGGIYIDGDSTISMSTDGSNNAVYNIYQGGTTKIVTVDTTNTQTTVETVSVGTETFQGLPDGIDDIGTIIYAFGNITSLGGAVQQDTELTISSDQDIVIQDNIQYSNYTAAVGNPGEGGYTPPHADGTANLLGIVSWNGDVRIGTSAPDNLDVHGTILAESGILTVDNYNDQGVGPRGTATILGGVITNNYGAFGLFNGSTGQQLSGFGRNFVYDERMLAGSAPPYFPSLNTFIAFTNDITDKMIWQEGDT